MFFFFFSSRRRHTRCSRDWSSDVCSSDLTLFATVFNAVDGVGANVGQGQRFTRVPRADLAGPGEWATHTPARATGPNAQACNACHNQPAEDGGGSAAANVHRDPEHSADLKHFIQRNTPHL